MNDTQHKGVICMTPELAQLLGYAFLGFMIAAAAALREWRANIIAARAASKVDEVKTTLVKTTAQAVADLKENTDITKDIHTLVNSNMGEQLSLAASSLREVATLRGYPEDMARAEEAEKLRDDHDAKQSVIDQRKAREG